MNLLLFLGSGISIPSGHPDVVTLTKRILNSKAQATETSFLKALRLYDEKARLVGGTYVSKKKYVRGGEFYRNFTSYEDLYYLCDEISSFDYGLHTNSMVPAFMGSLINEFAQLLKEKSKRKKFLEIGKLARDSNIYINNAVIKGLGTQVKIKGLDLIISLAKKPEVTSLNILTLNHDLLVEEFLLAHGIAFSDGFGSTDGDVRWFKPDTFISDTKVKIIKLHGSIDWYSFLVNGYEKVAKILGNSSDEKRNFNGATLKLLYKSPKVLSGLNKIKSYNSGIYTDIHYHFQRVLYENDIMIMSGYGWGDDPINNRLMTWLDKKRERKLILLHKYPEELMNRSMVFDRDRSNWEKFGKLKLIKKWLCDSNVEEVLEACS